MATAGGTFGMSELAAVFTALKALLLPYQAACDVVHDSAEHYYLDTRYRMSNNKPLFFAAVKTGKNYVSFYLMPVYVFPELLAEGSPALNAHMQGKSCFNFKTVEPALFAELRQMLQRGHARYVAAGYLPG